MSTRTPKLGEIVLYELTDGDATAINRRRTDAADSAAYHARIRSGAIVHTGNAAHGGVVEYVYDDNGQNGVEKVTKRGDIYPLIITRVWGDTPEANVNGQVLLDGNDSIWVTSVCAGDAPRKFKYQPEPTVWPTRIAG